MNNRTALFRKCNRITVIPLAVMLVTANFVFAQTYGWVKKVNVQGLGNPLTYNPLNSNTIYGSGLVSGTGAINVSYDRGEQWQLLSVVNGGMNIKVIIIHPQDTSMILVGQEGTVADRVMRTTDGGLTWAQTLSGDFNFFGVPVEFNPSHLDTVYTMMGTKLYRSIDFGSTWSVINANPGFNAWCDAALRPDSANVMYVGDNTTGIWKTTDGGVSFRKVFLTTGEIPMIAIDRHNPAVAYATRFSGGGGVLKTTDYGESWNLLPTFNGLNCWGIVISDAHPNLIVMGTFDNQNPERGIYISYDDDSTWTKITCGLVSPLNYGLLALDSSTIISLQDDGIYKLKSIDYQTLPRSTITGEILDSLSELPVHGTVYLSTTLCEGAMTYQQQTDSSGRFMFGNLYVTTPPFVSNYKIDIDPDIPYARQAVSSLHLDTLGVAVNIYPQQADVFVVEDDSSSYGKYYQAALDSLSLRYNYWSTTAKGTAPVQSTVRFKKQSLIYFTGNRHSPLDSAALRSLAACLDSGGNMFLTGQDIVELNDSSTLVKDYLGVGFGGNTSNSFVTGVSNDLFNGFSVFTSLGNGANNQTSRDVLVSNLPIVIPVFEYIGVTDTTIAAVRRDSVQGGGKVVVFGFGFEAISQADKRRDVMKNIIDYFDGKIILGVDDNESLVFPNGFRLEQNYPNPFNPVTHFQFSLPAGRQGQAGIANFQFVSLKVYDVLGREVATIVNERKKSGEYKVSWDGGNLPSGIYFYRLQTEKFTSVKKMLLLK